MLSKFALESARELAEVLEKRDEVIVPIQDTPVHELVTASAPVEQELPKTIEESIENLEIMSTQPIPLTGENHDQIQDNVAQETAALINRRIDLARNVINPLIAQYENIIREDIGDTAPVDPEVVEVNFDDDFYRNPSLNAVFSGYNIPVTERVVGFKGFGLGDGETHYTNRLKTGSKLIDGKINSIIQNRGDQWVENVVDTYFDKGEEVTVLNPEISEDYSEAVDRNFIIHMLARNYYNSDDIHGKYDSDEKYRLHLTQVLGRTAFNVRGLPESQNRWEQQDRIVASQEGLTMTVYGNTYRNFIQKGGNERALFGGFKKHRFNVTSNIVLQNKTALENLHEDEIQERFNDAASSISIMIVESARKHLPLIAGKIPEEVLDTIPEIDPEAKLETLLKRGYDYINRGREPSPDTLYQYVSGIITIGLLPELELNKFYQRMNHYLNSSNDNHSLTAKQAVYYVILEELSEYFLSQTSLDSK